MMHSPGTELQSARDSQTRLQQHLNAEAVICEREAAALRDRMEELEEEMQLAADSKERCKVALGAAECEWSLLHDEAEEAEQAASARNAEVERVTRQAREIQAQVHGVKEDILQCRQDHLALELKQERDLLHDEVQQEALRQEDLFLELDEARRSRSIFQCLFPRNKSQPPLPESYNWCLGQAQLTSVVAMIEAATELRPANEVDGSPTRVSCWDPAACAEGLSPRPKERLQCCLPRAENDIWLAEFLGRSSSGSTLSEAARPAVKQWLLPQ
ncbi:unnamed protein product [Symbiodinium pilosum]|uniref:Uncharacterized protein n=1 Tax=Symbiodinium pilosum TaxID=2952 RepID=A0A812LLM4_SYMPI|nr:unnamed protein product [Symbiodinium pilosum]